MKEKEEGKQEGEGRRTHTHTQQQQQKKNGYRSVTRTYSAVLSAFGYSTMRFHFSKKGKKQRLISCLFRYIICRCFGVFFSLLLFVLFHFTFLTCLFFFFFSLSPCCSKMLGVTGCCTLLRNLGVFPCNRFALTYILTHSEAHHSFIVALCFFFCVYIDAKGEKRRDACELLMSVKRHCLFFSLPFSTVAVLQLLLSQPTLLPLFSKLNTFQPASTRQFVSPVFFFFLH